MRGSLEKCAYICVCVHVPTTARPFLKIKEQIICNIFLGKKKSKERSNDAIQALVFKNYLVIVDSVV